MLTKTKILTTTLMATSALAISVSANADSENAEFKDDAYISLSGQVEKITDEDKFTLKYWGGELQIDVDDGNPDLFGGNINSYLSEGDYVTVSGTYDDNIIADNELDAKSIEIMGNNGNKTYYGYFSANQKPDRDNLKMYKVYDSSIIDNDKVKISGYISEILDEDEFMLSYGSGKIKIDADGIDLGEGAKFDKGDYVIVRGEFDKDLFETSEIEADVVTKVSYYYSG